MPLDQGPNTARSVLRQTRLQVVCQTVPDRRRRSAGRVGHRLRKCSVPRTVAGPSGVAHGLHHCSAPERATAPAAKPPDRERTRPTTAQACREGL